MPAIHRSYLLKDTKQLHAHVQIIPTGELKVEIVENKQSHLADFEQIRFEKKGRVTKLIGHAETNGKSTKWQLPLAHDDADELEKLIDQAVDDLEILMRSL